MAFVNEVIISDEYGYTDVLIIRKENFFAMETHSNGDFSLNR